MNKEETTRFNEYQLNSIKRKIALDFNAELGLENEKKSNLHRSVLNNLNVLIADLLAQGVKFYEIKFLEEISNLENTCIEVEEIINFLKTNVSMIEFVYLIIEKNKNSKEKNFIIKCILATRTLANITILSSLRDILNQLNENIYTRHLKGFSEIKKTWENLLAERNYKFHSFIYFSKFNQNLYGSLAELEVTFYPECGFDLSFFDGALDSDIPGISGAKNSKKKICINLINMFFYQKRLYLFGDVLFIKVEKSIYTYKVYSYIDYLDLNIVKIFNELKKKYTIQLKNLDLQDLLISCWGNVYGNFLKKRKNFFQTLSFYGNVIEFKDGLYVVDQNNFLDFEKNKEIFKNLESFGCYKYFDKNFKDLKEPLIWFKILNQFNILEIEKFSLSLGIYFNSRVSKRKKNVIEILSNQNTKVSKLIIKLSLLNINEISDKSDLYYYDYPEKQLRIVCKGYNCTDLETRKKLIMGGFPINFEFNSNINDQLLNDKIFIFKLLLHTLTLGCGTGYKINAFEHELAEIIVYVNNFFFQKENKVFLKKNIINFIVSEP